MTYRANSRLGWLTGIMVGLGLIALGVPTRLVSSWAYAVEKGKIQANGDQLAGPQEISNTFRMVARVAKPGVVQIKVSGSERDRAEIARVDKERHDAIRELRRMIRESGNDSDDVPRDVVAQQQRIQDLTEKRDALIEKLGRGTGSGVVYDADGDILTNNHVVDGRSEISVRLSDGREVPATLVGSDAKTDLALLKIEAPDLHALALGDSDQMEVGDWVLAVGAPFGLSQSVTHGIISAKGRHDIATGREIAYQDFMQTDAAINPGNSGGPLLNLRGEVVGINTAIATDGSGYNAGVAFTIPSNMARKIADQLRHGGSVARGWLGLTLQELSDSDVALLGLKDDKGAMVDVLYEGSPADKAGLRPEDVILRVDNRRVENVPDLRNAIAEVSPGTSCRLTIMRDGQEQVLTALLDRQPDNQAAWVAAAKPITGRNAKPLPLEVRSLREGMIESDALFRASVGVVRRAAPYIHAKQKGVVVMRTSSDVKSGEYDIEAGDLVVSANNSPVASVPELLKVLDAAKKRDAVQLQVVKLDGEERTVEVRLK